MLIENVDYTFDENGNLVFTEVYHLKRGFCCENKCRNCPWKFGQEKTKKEEPE